MRLSRTKNQKTSQNLLAYGVMFHSNNENSMNEPLILLVEDLIAVRQELADGLVDERFRVAEADSLTSAMAWLKDHEPHAAILDISLPDGTGFTIADHLRKRGIPFMFLTSHEETVIKQQIIDKGDMYHVKSPELTASRLAPNLHNLLQTSRKHQEDISNIKAAQPIDKAIGIYAERYGVSNEEARKMLKVQARSQGRPVLTIAEEILQERDKASKGK
jgi:DNA-binding response OmpR family regulator